MKLKYIRNFFLPALLVVASAGALVAPMTVEAVNPLKASCKAAKGNASEVCRPSGRLFGSGSIWSNIVNTLIFVIGAAAVLAIIVGGIQYVFSAGDEGQAKTARNTIVYAVIGLILAVAAGGIVNFVLGRL